MINSNKIKGRIYEQGYTIGKIAKQLGLTPYTTGQKVAGKRVMNLDEAFKLKRILQIPDGEEREYFFV